MIEGDRLVLIIPLVIGRWRRYNHLGVDDSDGLYRSLCTRVGLKILTSEARLLFQEGNVLRISELISGYKSINKNEINRYAII